MVQKAPVPKKDQFASPGRARHWNPLVAAWRRSGISMADFCRQHNLVYRTFCWWKWYLEKKANQSTPLCGDGPSHEARASESAFLPVQVVLKETTGKAPTGKGIEVVLAGGRRLHVHEDFDRKVLAKLVSTLEEDC